MNHQKLKLYAINPDLGIAVRVALEYSNPPHKLITMVKPLSALQYFQLSSGWIWVGKKTSS